MINIITYVQTNVKLQYLKPFNCVHTNELYLI